MFQRRLQLLGFGAPAGCEIGPATAAAACQLGHCLDNVARADALREVRRHACDEAQAAILLCTEDDHARAQVLTDGVNDAFELFLVSVRDREGDDLDSADVAGLLRQGACGLTGLRLLAALKLALQVVQFSLEGGYARV